MQKSAEATSPLEKEVGWVVLGALACELFMCVGRRNFVTIMMTVTETVAMAALEWTTEKSERPRDRKSVV